MLIFNKDFGLGTMNDQGGGTVINNQDINITTNGEYTADEGYTGIGTATVNVPEADIITALNNTGTAVSEGDKVWINQEAAYSSNFDIIGTPSLNETTQIVSGFSATSYIPILPDINFNNTWEFQIKVNTPADLSDMGIIVGEKGITKGIRLGIYNSHFYILTGNGTWFNTNANVGTYTVLASTTYYLKLGWTGSAYYVDYSLDGTDYTRDVSYNSSSYVTYDNYGMYLGYCPSENMAMTGGSIDLSETKMVVSGSDFWVPSFTKLADFTIGNLTVPKMEQNFTRVSSLVIDNMIASNFSRYNYIQETQHIDFTKPWEFNTAVTLGNYNDNQFIYVASNTTHANVNYAGFLLFASIGGGTFRFGGTVGFDVVLSLTLNQGVLYYLKCGWTGTEYYLGVSTDGTNYTYATPYSSTTPCQAIDNTFNLGGNSGWGTFYLYGTLYLSKTYIINNGEIVWSPYTTNSLTGVAKENIASGSTGQVETILPE